MKLENKGNWKRVKEISPGDLVLYKNETNSELRLILNITRRQQKNRSLWGLGWIKLGEKFEYKQGWFWSDSEYWVISPTSGDG